MSRTLRGRCVALENGRILVRNADGMHACALDSAAAIRVGDLIEVRDGQATRLAENRKSGAMPLTERLLDPRRLRAVGVRSRVEKGVRDFFSARDYIETRTPLLVPCPGMEVHIRPFEVRSSAGDRHWLPTSPEFAMKKLLAGGLERIFQMAPTFRVETPSSTHSPEFTMLEWYHAGAKLEELMEEVEALFLFLAGATLGASSLHFQGREIELAPPWPRLKIRNLYRDHVGVDLLKDDLRLACSRLGLKTAPEDTWDDLYFRIWLNCIEPEVANCSTPVMVYGYPRSQSALAELAPDSDGSLWARRFEVYGGGMELGNAFQELTDPSEQRRRFTADMEERAAIYGSGFPKTAPDEDFLRALDEGLPPTAGIAMGLDRIIMLLADEPEISKTFWL